MITPRLKNPRKLYCPGRTSLDSGERVLSTCMGLYAGKVRGILVDFPFASLLGADTAAAAAWLCLDVVHHKCGARRLVVSRSWRRRERSVAAREIVQVLHGASLFKHIDPHGRVSAAFCRQPQQQAAVVDVLVVVWAQVDAEYPFLCPFVSTTEDMAWIKRFSIVAAAAI